MECFEIRLPPATYAIDDDLRIRLLDEVGGRTGASPAVVFLDSSVSDRSRLRLAMDDGIDAVYLSGASGGTKQMAAFLANRRNLAEVHIVAHGSSGRVTLGAATVDASSFHADSAEWAVIGSALDTDGDLALWSCDVAAGSVGRDFIANLAAATGADVAAADHVVGSAMSGGDWRLNVRTENAEVTSPFNASALAAYDGILGTWATAANMAVGRTEHTATRMGNGKVLVVGGVNGGTLNSVEVYDPIANTWATVASLGANPRRNHTATLLTNGKVLVVGGDNSNTGGRYFSAVLYDPTADTWTSAGSMTTARFDHQATLLGNGKVLVTGGQVGGGGTGATAELYDPGLNTWSPAASMSVERFNHTATLMSNNRVLVAGGFNFSSGDLSSAEIYDPLANTWSSAAGFAPNSRSNHRATALPNGRVLMTGGQGSSATNALLYDWGANAWFGAGTQFRWWHGSTALSDGKVLISGGYNGGPPLATSAVYNPTTNAYIGQPNLPTVRFAHESTLLANGKVLVTGGIGADGFTSLTTTALFTPDETPPTLTSFTRFSPAADTTNADALTFRATFNESVTAVDAADFVVNGSTTATITSVSGTGNTRNVVVSGGNLASFNGTVGINLSGSQNITDGDGNALPAGEPGTDQVYTVDNLAPSLLSFLRRSSTPTNADSLVFRATFGEAVTNVDAADFVVTGTTANIEGIAFVSDGVYDITLSGGNLASLNGTVGLNVSASRNIVDFAGNLLPASEPGTDETYLLDNDPPGMVSIVRSVPAGTPTDADSLIFRVTFDEAVFGVGLTDFAVNGATTAAVSGVSLVSAAVYDVTVSGGDLAGFNGEVGLNLAATQDIVDQAGNALPLGEPATDETYTVANGPPPETSVVLSGGNLIVTDINGGTSNDTLTISLVGGNVRITDPAQTFSAGVGTTLIDPNTVEIPFASISGNIQVNTLGGNDTLTLNFADGNLLPTGGLTVDSGNPAVAPGDKLVISGGSQGLVTYNNTTVDSGSVVMSAYGTVTYAGLESIANSGSSTDVVINPPAGPNTVSLGDDTASGNGLSRLSAATFVTTDFANPSGSVTVNRGHAADTITVVSLPDFTARLSVGSLANPWSEIAFTGTIQLAVDRGLSARASGNVTLSSTASIALTGAVGGAFYEITADADGNGSGSYLQAAGSTVQTVAVAYIQAADVDFAGTLSVSGQGVVLRPSTPAATIGIGSPGSFNVSTAELTRVTAAAPIGFGDATNTGGIALAASEPVTGHLNEFSLETGGSISVGNFDVVSGTYLGLFADKDNNGTGAITSGSGRLQAGRIESYAAQGITLHTQIGSLEAVNSTAGDIVVDELDYLYVLYAGGVRTLNGNGNVSLSAGNELYIDHTGVAAHGSGTVLLSAGTALWTYAPVVSGSGAVTLLAQDGIVLDRDVSDITTAGAITLNTGVLDFEDAGAAISGSSVSVVAADIDLVGTISSTGVTTLVSTAGRQIDLGVNTIGKLSLTDTELDRITAGTLQIGDANSGAMTISAAITHGNHLSLTTGADVTIDNAVTMAANKNLTVAAAGVYLPGSQSDLSLGGVGAVSITAARHIGAGNISPGASIAVVDGDLTLTVLGGIFHAAGAIALGYSTLTTAGTGDIRLTGVGGTQGGHGINLGFTEIGSTSASPDAGDITIHGASIAGGCCLLNHGIRTTSASIHTVNGDISLTGVGANTGVELELSNIHSSGTGENAGTITIEGTAGEGLNAAGVDIAPGPVTISSVDGDVAIRGATPGEPDLFGFNAGHSVGTTLLFTSTGDANITVFADSINFLPFGNLNAGSSHVTLQPLTPATVAIHLGGVDAAGTLGLTDEELDHITAGMIRIGAADSGPITVSEAITRAAATAITLNSGAAIEFTTGSLSSAGGNITLNPGTNVNPATNGIEIDAGLGTLTFGAGDDLALVINGTNVDTQYRQLNVGGGVNLSGADLVISGSLSAAYGQTFVLVNNDGVDPIVGTFSGLPEGGTISNPFGGNFDGKISYVGGTGNDVTLRIVPNTQYVTQVTPLTAGVHLTLSRPVAYSPLNLYDHRDGSGVFVLGPADVQVLNGAGQPIAGSLVVAPGDMDFTFIATGGALPPDTYTLALRSATDGFQTVAGELLDGDYSGVPGGEFSQTFTVAAPPVNNVVVSLPHFSRGPDQPVNVPADVALGLPIRVSNGNQVGSLTFDLHFDAGLLNVTGVNLPAIVPGGSTANLTTLGAGHVRVTLTFGSPLAAGAQTVAYLQAAVPASAASRYGERGVLDVAMIDLRDGGGAIIPALDQDAVHANAYYGDVGRNGRYDSFDVQQASRLALRTDTGFQQHTLLDPTIIGDFNGNNRIDSFDVQRLSRLALRLPINEAPPLPAPLPTVTDTDRIAAEENPPAEPTKPTDPAPTVVTPPRSDIDGNGAVDAQDVLWAIYYFRRSPDGEPPTAAAELKLDVNGDSLFDAADILFAITDLNAAQAAEGETDSLAALLATDIVASRTKK